MDILPLARLATALSLGLLTALTCSAQQVAAPAPAPAAAPAASGASAPPPPPITMLPKWMQEKLTAARADPKLMDHYYKLGQKTASFCMNCHGAAGQSVLPEVPNLAAQNTIYVLNQLSKLSDGRRKHFFMEGLMRAMNQEEKIAVAVYYTAQEPKAVPASSARAATEGKALYDKLCKKCHQETGHGTERNARLAGQQPVYLKANLERFREQSAVRGSNERKYKLMKDMTNNDISLLVEYIRSMQ